MKTEPITVPPSRINSAFRRNRGSAGITSGRSVISLWTRERPESQTADCALPDRSRRIANRFSFHGAPGPEGREPTNSVRTPKVAAARGVFRRFVRPGVFAAGIRAFVQDPAAFSLRIMISLARKYRPKSFAEVAVQTHVSNTLRGAIARGRVAHGYLLCGPRGTGKTTLARVLAMALNCEQRSESGEPDGTCTSCVRIWSGASSLDVV